MVFASPSYNLFCTTRILRTFATYIVAITALLPPLVYFSVDNLDRAVGAYSLLACLCCEKGNACTRPELLPFRNLSDLHSTRRALCLTERERDCFYYIIEQTYDVGLHSRRHPMEFDAGTRPFASFDAPSSYSRRRRERRVCVCVCVFTCVIFNIEYIVYICI